MCNDVMLRKLSEFKCIKSRPDDKSERPETLKTEKRLYFTDLIGRTKNDPAKTNRIAAMNSTR